VSRSAIPPKPASLPIGSSSGHAGAELVAQLVEGALEAGPLPVELVHEDHPGHAEPGRSRQMAAVCHLDAVDRGHDEHREVDHPERGQHVARKSA